MSNVTTIGSIPIGHDVTVASRLAENLRRARKDRETIKAYHIAISACREAVAQLGGYQADLVMDGGWDEDAFWTAVGETIVERGNYCTLIVELRDWPKDDDGVPLRPTGVCRIANERDGDRMVDFEASGTVFRAGQRLFACYEVWIAE